MRLLVVDAGHGNHFTGAAANGLREEDIAMAIQWRLARILDGGSITVALSRPFQSNLTDYSVARDLRLRAEMANRIRADRFISIHTNNFHDPSVRGFEVWYHKGSVKGEEFAKRVNKAMASILPDMRNRGVRMDRERARSGFQILRQTAMPAILVEVGFLSNPEDAKILGSDEGQWTIAQALAEGIINEFESLEA